MQEREDEYSGLQYEIYKTVTNLYATREAALKAKKSYAENLANIAHQIKTPLTAADLSLQLMESNAPNPYIQPVRRQAERLNRLEAALLTLSRIDAGALELKSSAVDVYTVDVYKRQDPDTHDSWYQGDLGVSGQGGDSTRNTGRVWTDKSVYTEDVTLTSQGGEATFTIENDEGTALVGLSALSSAANISGQTTINQPLDIVLVLDRSGSMAENMDSYSYSPTYNIRNNGNYYVMDDDCLLYTSRCV